ncbi:MAG: AI-2E family transporter [Bdellovibrionales bacterium]|nr:AI-2E family transporter [Bdellovibrionales bacterium]
MIHNNKLLKVQRIKILFFLVSMAVGLAVLLFVKNLLVSTFIAVVGFFLLKPFVDFLERKGLSRLVSTLFPFIFFSLLFLLLGLIFIPMLSQQMEALKLELPKYLAGIQKILMGVEDKLDSIISLSTKDQLSVQVQDKIRFYAESFFRGLPNVLSNSLTVMFLAPFLAFFMLLDGRQFSRQIITTVPNAYFELILYLQHQMIEQMGGFIRARLLESLIVSIVVFTGLMILNFPYALVLAIFAGIMNLIPYLGPVVGILPAILVAWINKDPASVSFWILSIYLLAQAIDAVIIVPIVVAKIVNLHAVTVVIAVMIGSQLMGVLGMIISIPVASALKVIYTALYNHFTDNKN